MKKENANLYFYAVCLEYENGEYYYRYEKRCFPYENHHGTCHIEKTPGCPFYLDSTYTPDAFNTIHGVKNHWYAYVVCPQENEAFAKRLLVKELERRHRQALGIVDATTAMLNKLHDNPREIER